MVFKNFFSRYALLSNTLTFTGLFAAGDFVQQQLELRRHKNTDDQETSKKTYDLARTLRMITMGALVSPGVHLWYVALDKIIVGKILHQVVLKKVLADEIMMGPLSGVIFLGGMSKLEGKHFNESWDEVKVKFWPMYKVELTIWPAAQALNFYVVPPHYRVAYVSFVTLIWNVFLSYIKHKDM